MIVFKERFEQLLGKSVSRIEAEKGENLSLLEVAEIQKTLKLHLEKRGFFLMIDTEKPVVPNKKKHAKSSRRARRPHNNQTQSQANWLSSKNIY